MNHKDKKHLFRQQFKKLVGDFLSRDFSQDPRVVLFTSATPREGTTTVAREFSEALVAQSGKRVSLVDSSKLGESPRPQLEKTLVERLKIEYDYVVIDAPPVLEAPEISRWMAVVDGLYFVIASEKSRRPVIGKSLDMLRRQRAPILGLVLNKRRYPIPDSVYKFLYC